MNRGQTLLRAVALTLFVGCGGDDGAGAATTGPATTTTGMASTGDRALLGEPTCEQRQRRPHRDGRNSEEERGPEDPQQKIERTGGQFAGERLDRKEQPGESERPAGDDRLGDAVAASERAHRRGALPPPGVAERKAGEEDGERRRGRQRVIAEQATEIPLPDDLLDQAGGSGHQGQ